MVSTVFIFEIEHSSMTIKPLLVATTGKFSNLKHICPGTAEKSKSTLNSDALNIFSFISVSLTKQKFHQMGVKRLVLLQGSTLYPISILF